MPTYCSTHLSVMVRCHHATWYMKRNLPAPLKGVLGDFPLTSCLRVAAWQSKGVACWYCVFQTPPAYRFRRRFPYLPKTEFLWHDIRHNFHFLPCPWLDISMAFSSYPGIKITGQSSFLKTIRLCNIHISSNVRSILKMWPHPKRYICMLSALALSYSSAKNLDSAFVSPAASSIGSSTTPSSVSLEIKPCLSSILYRSSAQADKPPGAGGSPCIYNNAKW